VAGLTVESVDVSPPGRFASVGSLVVVCRRDDRVTPIFSYVGDHS
jgi:hypothetical protein